MRAWLGTGLAALASGALLWAASPAVSAGWLAWIALAPAAVASLVFAESRAGRAALPLAYAVALELMIVPALPFGLLRRQFGDPALPVLLDESPVLFAGVVAIPLFGLLLYALRFPALRPDGGLLWLLVVPALAWTALDVLRTKLDPSGLWGPLFLSQHDLSTARLAALAGPWLLTFALVAVNYALALLVVRRRNALAGVAAVAVPLGALAGVAVAAGTPADGRSLAVAAVQPGYDTSEFERPVLRHIRRETRDYELLTRDLARDLAPATATAGARGAALVAWPEATAWVDPGRNPRVREELAELAREAGAAVVVPFFRRADRKGAAVVMRADGSVTRPQPKQRPMWFLDEEGGNRVPPEPVPAAGVDVGTLLGVDNQDAGVARALVAAGAGLLVSSTHDWDALAEQQRAFTQLHAAALAVPVVRADWRYGSAVFAAGGRLVADAGAGKRAATVAAEVTLRTGETPYARIGDVLAWAAVGAAAALWLLVTVRASAGWRRRAAGSRG